MGNPISWTQFTKLFDQNLRDVRDEETRFSDLKSMIPKLYNVINSDRAEEQFFEVGSVPDIPVFNGKFSTLSVYPGYYQKIEPKEFGAMIQIQRKLIDDKKFGVMSNMGRGLMKAGNRTKEKYAVRPFANATSVAFDFMASEEGKSLASTSHTTKAQGVSTTTGFSNSGTSAMTKTSVAATRLLMKGFRSSIGERIDTNENYALIYPDALAETAFEINFTQKGLNSAEGNENFQYKRYETIPYSRLDDYSTTSWGMVDLDRMKEDLLWINRINPELARMGDFETMMTKIRLYMRFGYGFRDWRWIYWQSS